MFFVITIFIDLVNGQNSTSGINWAFISLAFLILFSLQFVFQIRYFNWIFGVILILASIYFSLAVLSEFLDFSVPNKDAYSLLTVGFLLCFSGIILGILILRSLIKDI